MSKSRTTEPCYQKVETELKLSSTATAREKKSLDVNSHDSRLLKNDEGEREFIDV
jgi:hypothetical protein